VWRSGQRGLQSIIEKHSTVVAGLWGVLRFYGNCSLGLDTLATSSWSCACSMCVMGFCPVLKHVSGVHGFARPSQVFESRVGGRSFGSGVEECLRSNVRHTWLRSWGCAARLWQQGCGVTDILWT
jgi:hypothetical protein